MMDSQQRKNKLMAEWQASQKAMKSLASAVVEEGRRAAILAEQETLDDVAGQPKHDKENIITL